MKRMITIAAGILILGANPAPAQDLSLSLSAGVFFPRQEAYREIYGTGIPASLEIWAGFTKSLGASAGLIRLRQTGRALPFGGGDEEYPLEFRMLSLPISLFYRTGRGGLTFRFGVGAVFHSYTENWQTVEVSSKGTKWSFWAHGSLEVRLFSRLRLIGSIRHMNIPVQSGSPLVGDVDLGGLTAAAGLSFRIR